MSVGAVAVAGIGAVASMSAADKAAKAQQAGIDSANALQQGQYAQTRDDNRPWRQAGQLGVNRLSYLLGLDANAETPLGSLAGQPLVSNVGGTPTYNSMLYENNDAYRRAWDEFADQHLKHYGRGYGSGSSGAEIEKALRTRLDGSIAADKERQQQMSAAAPNDPAFGSLMREYGADEFWADDGTQLGLQFGLDEGRKGLNRMAAASGGVLSGATQKALTRFGSDYMSTKFNEGFNRDQAKKSTTFNMLSGISGTGQAATQQVNAAGQNMANNVSNNMIGMGNARAASAIGQANAITGALGQGYNMWQQNKLLGSLNGGGVDPYTASINNAWRG